MRLSILFGIFMASLTLALPNSGMDGDIKIGSLEVRQCDCCVSSETGVCPCNNCCGCCDVSESYNQLDNLIRWIANSWTWCSVGSQRGGFYRGDVVTSWDRLRKFHSSYGVPWMGSSSVWIQRVPVITTIEFNTSQVRFWVHQRHPYWLELAQMKVKLHGIL